MADNPNPNDPNHSLHRRREERLNRQTQEGAINRMTDFTTANLDVSRSLLTWWATAAGFYADSLHNTAQALTQMTEQTEQIIDQTRRTG